MNFIPIYTTVDNVKVRLANKVQFQADPAYVQDGEIPNELLTQIIVDSETEVEQDLRSRYAIPFQSKRTRQYVDLPDHTRRALRNIVDMKCVMNILSTDFGRGTHVNADDYKKDLDDRYQAQVELLLGHDKEGANSKHDRYRFSPPLDDLLLARTNREADDGYKGMIINTDADRRDSATYAIDQVNDPSKSYIRKRGWGMM